jgi:phospholipid/cholesterol/gamma-HCH transport system ATP-binding protein
MNETLKLSILVITHDPNTLVSVCDRIAMLADGKVEVGTLSELRRSSNAKVREYLSNPRITAILANAGKGK